MNISDQIHNIIKSDDFESVLEKINTNYSNLKQEGIIRNAILELYNEKYANEQFRAFAEHPRVQKNNGEDKRKSSNRVDLSITDLHLLVECKKELKPKTYNIELKYHFPNPIFQSKIQNPAVQPLQSPVFCTSFLILDECTIFQSFRLHQLKP